jgi:GAF domain-containing protein
MAETVINTVDVGALSVVWRRGGGRRVRRAVRAHPRTHSRGRAPSLTVHPNYTAALRSERSIVASDAQRDPRTAEFTDVHFIPLGIGALIDVAVRLGGEVAGMFSVEHVGPPRVWHGEDVDFVTSVAGLVEVAIESAKRRETERALERSGWNTAASSRTHRSPVRRGLLRGDRGVTGFGCAASGSPVSQATSRSSRR